MYKFLHSEMLDAHVTNEKALKMLNTDIDYRRIFDTVLVGVNLVSTDSINDVAVFLTSLDKKRLIKLTFADLIEAVGQYEDLSGSLM